MTRRCPMGRILARGLLPAVIAVAGSGSGVAATPPDAGQALQQMQAQPPPSIPSVPVPTLRDESTPAQPVAADNAVQIPVGEIKLVGNTVFATPVLATLLADLPGSTRSLDELKRAVQRVTDYYRARGYLLARAYLPPQEVRDGVLTVAIVEGTVDWVKVDNHGTLYDESIQSLLDAHLPAGRPLRADAANRALLLLQDTPGVGVVQGSLRPGMAVGSTAVYVRVDPQPLVTGSLGADNAGNPYTGQGRVLADLNANNLTGYGDRINLQGVVAEHNELDYGHLSWDTAAGTDGLRLGAAVGDTRYALGGRFSALDAHGTADTVSLYGRYPMWLAPASRGNVNLSLERRYLHDEEESVLFDSRKSAKAAVFTLDGDFTDAWLGSLARNAWRVANTAGHLDLQTPGVALADAGSARTAGDYDRIVLGVTREQRMLSRLALYVAGTAQRSSRNLDSSEQFVLGGPNGIRAYPTGEGIGDQGWLATLELRYQVVDALQLAVFEDVGAIDINRNPYIAQENGRHLSGAGLGANGAWGAFSLKGSLAWRGSEVPVSDSDRRPRMWIAGSYAF